MSDKDQEVKALLPEGEYPAKIIGMEEYDSRGSGTSFIRIFVEVKGYKVALYQVCAPLLRSMVLAQSNRFIGQKVIAKIRHEVYGDSTYHSIKAMALK